MTSQKAVTSSLHDDKGTWVVRGRVFDPDTGKTRQRSKSTKLKVSRNTKRKALQMMADITKQWELEANGTVQVVRKEPPVSYFVNNWLDKKQAVSKGNTIKAYRGYAAVHILPALGTIPIRKLTLGQLQEFYNGLFQILKVNSVRKIHVVLSGALLDAVREQWITANIAEYIQFPKAQKFEGNAYTPEQATHLLRAAEEAGEPLRAAVTLAICYGLRREEIIGLRWCDINFTENILMVRNTVVQEGDLRLEEERTKTNKSRRIIGLVNGTETYFLELKRKQEQTGIKLDKVCVWPDGREVRPDYLTKYVPRLMKEAGLPVIRLHDLRHTAASILAMSCSPKQVQEFLGHEDIKTTMNIYTHLMDSERRATSAAMGDILKKSGFCSENCSEFQNEENNENDKTA